MRWFRTWHRDPAGAALADRHYSRRSVGSQQFTPPGRKLIFVTPRGDAVWCTIDQKRETVKHAWPGAWCCSLFRNESPHLSSELITEAIAATVERWGPLPAEGLITFVDAEATRARRSRRARPGECFRRAGFVEVGTTPGGHGRSPKVVLRLGGSR